MRLLEFSNTPLTFKDALNALQKHFRLERVGGAARVYMVGQQLGVVYLIDGGPHAIGLTWMRGSKALGKIYYWSHFNVAHSPDLVADIPQDATVDYISPIVNFVTNPHAGIVTEDAEPVPANDDIPAEEIKEIRIMARNASGEWFVVPGLDSVITALEHRLSAQNGDKQSMEEQYESLREKVRLVAGNQSHNIKSLLIYGAPSSGKTFTVMQVVKELGLKEGVDYVVKKGSITDFAAYRTLIQNIDGLVIFDDCDSVVATKVGKNMLKGALDTYPVRELSYDNANTIDTDAMTSEDRRVFVDAMSRVMKGTASADDVRMFDRYAVSDKKTPKKSRDKVVVGPNGDFELPDPDEFLSDLENGSNAERLHELQDYFSRRLPNKIDYRGRIIFISNMGEDEWDSAILTRTFRQYMAFGDGEMLDFIERIQSSLSANLTPEQKQEVIDWIRVLHDSGQLKSPINFRLVQQAFDLRLNSVLKQAIDDL